MSSRSGGRFSGASPSWSCSRVGPAPSRLPPSVSSKGFAVISLRWVSSCVLVLSLVPSVARGDDPSLADWVQHRVEDGLLKPLANRESHSFSRARPPPHERRVRALQTTATPDKSGHPFVPFAIDIRFGDDEWQ